MKQVNSGVYRLFWNSCHEFYIGRSKNIKKRYQHHLRELKSAKHDNAMLFNAYVRFGNPQIEIIHEGIFGLALVENRLIGENLDKKGCCNTSNKPVKTLLRRKISNLSPEQEAYRMELFKTNRTLKKIKNT